MSHDLMSKALSIYIIHNMFHESSRFFFYIVNIITVAILNYIVFKFINLQRLYIKNGSIQMSKKMTFLKYQTTLIVLYLCILKPIIYAVFLRKTSRLQKLFQP